MENIKDMNNVKAVHNYLRVNNINNSKKGYIYLASVIELGLNQTASIYRIMQLYEIVAEKYDKNTNSIAKGIRDVLKDSGFTSKEFITDAVYSIKYPELN